MKAIKWLLAIVAVLAAVVVLGGMAISPTFKVTRSMVIDAPAETVYAHIADPRRWQAWSVWNRRDPTMQIEYFGAPSGAGAGWAWKSKTVATTMAITMGQNSIARFQRICSVPMAVSLMRCASAPAKRLLM